MSSSLIVHSGSLNRLCNLSVFGISGLVSLGLLYTLMDDQKPYNNKKIKNFSSLLCPNVINNPLGAIGLVGGLYYGYCYSPIVFLKR